MKVTRIVFEENGCKGKTFDSPEELTNFEREEKLDYILNDTIRTDYRTVKIQVVPEYDRGN